MEISAIQGEGAKFFLTILVTQGLIWNVCIRLKFHFVRPCCSRFLTDVTQSSNFLLNYVPPCNDLLPHKSPSMMTGWVFKNYLSIQNIAAIIKQAKKLASTIDGRNLFSEKMSLISVQTSTAVWRHCTDWYEI